MPAAARIAPATPPAERFGDCYPETSDGPPGDGGPLSGLTIRHVADELWLQLADDADAWRGEHERESNPHVCRYGGCCDERVAVQL